jgi:hypothetical protein
MVPITAPYEEYENQREAIFTMAAQPVDCTRRLPIHASVKTGNPPPNENRIVNRIEPPMPIGKFRLPPRKSAMPARKNLPIAYVSTAIEVLAPTRILAWAGDMPWAASSSMISGRLTEKSERQR